MYARRPLGAALSQKRFITISETAIASSNAHQLDHESVTLVGTHTAPNAQFQVLGTPPGMLAAPLAPAAPVYIRKGTLVSLQTQTATAGESPVRTAPHNFSLWKSFVYGNVASSYQRLVSDVPCSVLISPSPPRDASDSPKSVANVVLDGRVDWAVLQRSALQAYTGPSVSVSLERTPARISQALSRALGLPPSHSTGLARWSQSGYVFASGRGQVALAGEGQIYRVILKHGESYLVNRANLLAISVNGTSDLANCAAAHRLDDKAAPSASAYLGPTYGALAQLRMAWHSVSSTASSFSDTVFDFFVDRDSYVKVVGPRNLLIQTNGEPHGPRHGVFASGPRATGTDVARTESQIAAIDGLKAPGLAHATFLAEATRD